MQGSLFGTSFAALNHQKSEKLNDVQVKAKLTLKEFYCGTHKVVLYERQVVGLDGRTVKQETSTVEVVVKPGMLSTEKLYFPGLGNQQPKSPATNLIVSFELSSKDKYFSRVGTNDLMFRYFVSLPDVLNCTPIRLTSLDGSILNIPVDRVMSPGEVMEVKGAGFLIDTSILVNAT